MQTISSQGSTVAEAFTTFLLPHILFVKDYDVRQKSVATCWIAWNIGLIANDLERKRKIDQVCQLADDDEKAPSEKAETFFKSNLQKLVTCRRTLFPRLNTGIKRVELQSADKAGIDLLHVQTACGADIIELNTEPALETVSDTLTTLAYLGKTTAQQRRELQKPWYFQTDTDIQATRRAAAYSLQLADLIGYAVVLTAWANKVTDPAKKESLLYWLEVLNDIIDDTQAVLVKFAGI